MRKRYLEPGETVSIDFFGRLGPSGTIVDLQPDVTKMVKSAGGNDETAKTGHSIGTILRDGDTSDVYVEIETGRLWHDEDQRY